MGISIRLHQATKCSPELKMAQRQRTPALQLNFNRCHCPAPNTNLATAFYLLGSGKLSLVDLSLAFSAGLFLSIPATFSSLGPCSSQSQLGPGACLPEPSFSHLLRMVSSDSLCPLLAPPLSSPFPLPPFQESFQPLAASSVQFPQCLSAFRKSRRKQMYPWEVTDSYGDLSL